MAIQIKGPGIFLAQFVGDAAPFASLANITKWGTDLGCKGVQIQTFDTRLLDLDKAAMSDTYCEEVRRICADAGVEITELSTHLQGQLVAVNSAYNAAFDIFSPREVHGSPTARTEWAIEQMKKAALAWHKLGLKHTVSFTGFLAFPFLYPWPQRPTGLIEETFAEWDVGGPQFWIITKNMAKILVLKSIQAKMFLPAQYLKCLLIFAVAMKRP